MRPTHQRTYPATRTPHLPDLNTYVCAWRGRRVPRGGKKRKYDSCRDCRATEQAFDTRRTSITICAACEVTDCRACTNPCDCAHSHLYTDHPTSCPSSPAGSLPPAARNYSGRGEAIHLNQQSLANEKEHHHDRQAA